MGKWKDVFVNSENYDEEDECVFNPPATEEELAGFEAEIGASLPADLREMLSEFNGINKLEYGRHAPFILGIDHLKLPEFYTDWDEPTDNLIAWSKNIVYVRQFNNFTYLYGIVVKPFESFKIGDVVGFDHDDIDEEATASEFFAIDLKSLKDIILD